MTTRPQLKAMQCRHVAWHTIIGPERTAVIVPFRRQTRQCSIRRQAKRCDLLQAGPSPLSQHESDRQQDTAKPSNADIGHGIRSKIEPPGSQTRCVLAGRWPCSWVPPSGQGWPASEAGALPDQILPTAAAPWSARLNHHQTAGSPRCLPSGLHCPC